jgi:methylmalonyl-CoA mutase N-terminal domain/subunit
MATCAYDEALSIPTEESATLAVRTQQIIAYESGAADVIDPLAGSYYVESMTDKFERDADVLIAKITDMGGAIAAIEKGWMQSEILASAYAQQMAIEKNEKVIVGVNKFTDETYVDINLTEVDITVRNIQIEKIAKLKANRDGEQVKEALTTLTEAAGDKSANLMPPILRAVKAYATLGEICDCLREVFGVYKAPKTI